MIVARLSQRRRVYFSQGDLTERHSCTTAQMRAGAAMSASGTPELRVQQMRSGAAMSIKVKSLCLKVKVNLTLAFWHCHFSLIFKQTNMKFTM